ncbi:ATP-binding protein [Uliginosibacterium sp. H3]|uniref:histidine kinase n=1 Tax=Uliginosibacterium silvisoli TaxID=3114758 RepID=A0ABU6K4Y3_9RHOO|nr:ATP-binding protein [Uliginosibacterium sp. H3]
MTTGIPVHSIRLKIMLVVLITTFFSLLIAGTAMMLNDWRQYRGFVATELATLANVVNRASAPALAFNDKKEAAENLALLEAAPAVKAAAIYTAKGELFASYAKRDGEEHIIPRLPGVEGLHEEGGRLSLYQRMVDNEEILGTLFIESSSDASHRLLASLGILLAVMVLSLLVAFLLSNRLQRSVTGPVLSVTEVARRVVDGRDFTLRAQKTSSDEIGFLVEAFNDMLAEIGKRAVALEASNQALAQEVSDRNAAQRALQVSERRNRVLVSASAAVTWLADEHGAWRSEHPQWEAYTGQSSQAYMGLGWRNAFHVDDRETMDLAWAQALAEGQAFEIEVRLWHQATRECRFVTLRAVASIDDNGKAMEWIGSISDIHDRRTAEEMARTLNRELEQRVTQRTAQLEEANRELESFSYSVSHDLRSPVRAVTGFSKILAQDASSTLSAEGLRLLGIIQSEAARMGALIDDLLTFSRLGRKAIQPTVLDMHGLAESTFSTLAAQHQGPVAELLLGTLPEVEGDRSLIAQVWSNLLSNALKFSAKRERPLIEIGSISEDDDYVFFVRDNGAGFDPRYKAKLFGVFQRLHDASDFAGTGVGLALVHRIITRHGGRVWADSVLDQGATFYFTLPKEFDHGRN